MIIQKNKKIPNKVENKCKMANIKAKHRKEMKKKKQEIRQE